ncbi:MAG: hypothetical protein HY908_33470 [Myxococcales bacterium]|nr:hypothetical protein [Myxococcales bacterium]
MTGAGSGRAAALVLGAAALGLAGCVDTDATIFVEVTIVDPTGIVADQVLGTSLDGSFGIELHLGPRAAGDSTVTLGGFSVQNADRTQTLVASLPLATSPGFPVTVPVDSTVSASATFGMGASLLPKAAYGELCAGAVVLSGTFDDSLLAATAIVASDPFLLGGCP